MTQTRKRVGVVLSGCGFLDGSEIQEATLTLLALDRLGAQAVPLAPKANQREVVDHLAGAPVAGLSRGILEESARITRGEIRELDGISASELDALIFPGGYGAAKNLCTFASQGAAMTVLEEVEQLILAMRQADKPMGFICIAPVIAAKVLSKERPLLTIGNEPATAAALESLGGQHQVRTVEEIAIDPRLKLVSTPAYMLGPSIAKVAIGIERLVSAVLTL